MHRAMPKIAPLFDHVANRPRFGYIIACGNPQCRIKELLPTERFRTPPAWEFFAKHFTRIGWAVGNKPANDRCPACVDAEKLERRNKHLARAEAVFAAPGARPAQAPPLVPASNVVQMQAPLQFGPTYDQLKELQSRFNDGPSTPAAMRARIAELKKMIGDHYREMRQLEIKLLGAPVLHLAGTNGARSYQQRARG